MMNPQSMQGLQPHPKLMTDILLAANRERTASDYWVKHAWCETGIEKMNGHQLQDLINRKREDFLVMKDETQEEKWASEFGFGIPDPIIRGQQTVTQSAPVSALQPPKDFEHKDTDLRSPEELALEMLPDEELYALAVQNHIDLPPDAFDRSFTVSELLKNHISPNPN